MAAGPPRWVESSGLRIQIHPWRLATAVARAVPSVGGDFHYTWCSHGGMKGIHENASFGSHADRFFREAWAFGCQGKSPLPFSSAVVNLKRSWRTFMKMQASRWPPRSVAAVARVKLVAPLRSAPTLPSRPPFSSAVTHRTGEMADF